MDQIGVNIGICVGNSNGNFQLNRFTTSENIAKSFRRATFFDSHCRMSVVQTVMNTTLCRCGVSAILTPSARAVTKYFGGVFSPVPVLFSFHLPFPLPFLPFLLPSLEVALQIQLWDVGKRC